MSTGRNKALYHRFLAAINARDFATAEALVAPDAVNHTPLPGEPSGLAGFRYRMEALSTAFPDCRFTTEEIIEEGDKVVTRGVMTGANTGPFAGMPPTGKPVRVAYIDLLRFSDGRMVEHAAQLDQLGLLQQLGAIPAPEGASA